MCVCIYMCLSVCIGYTTMWRSVGIYTSERRRPEDSVYPMHTDQTRSGATDMYHGSRLQQTHKN